MNQQQRAVGNWGDGGGPMYGGGGRSMESPNKVLRLDLSGNLHPDYGSGGGRSHRSGGRGRDDRPRSSYRDRDDRR